MIKTLFVVASCLFTAVSASSAAAAQPLPGPAPAVCLVSSSPEQVALFAPKSTNLCGRICDTSEGGTTSTLESLGVAGSCPAMTSDLASRLTAAANTACHNLTGFNACNIVLHTSGCVPDGDVDYLIDFGYATYNCFDTTC
jgi:hypothetical protein